MCRDHSLAVEFAILSALLSVVDVRAVRSMGCCSDATTAKNPSVVEPSFVLVVGEPLEDDHDQVAVASDGVDEPPALREIILPQVLQRAVSPVILPRDLLPADPVAGIGILGENRDRLLKQGDDPPVLAPRGTSQGFVLGAAVLGDIDLDRH